MTHVAIIDCGAGNLHSVRKAFARVMGAEPVVTTDAAALSKATHIVLPGVSAFADCMSGLNALPGMRDALGQEVHNRKKPFLGICVGMQMLFERGHEHGVHAGLGWFKGEVKPLAPKDSALKIPHMGWNQLRVKQQHAFLKNIHDGEHAYFVHSFAVQQNTPDILLASVDYGGEIVAIIGQENIVATQFHPEKSQRVGLQLISNFLEM